VVSARVGLTLALLLFAPACAPAPGDAVPYPDLAGVEADVVRAVDEARASVEADPESAKAWGQLGMRYFAHEFNPEALACFRRAEELEPENPRWPYRIGWTLFDEQPEAALEPFHRALGMQPDYAPLHEALGRIYVRLDQSDRAEEHWRRASELDPESAHAETGLGQLELSRGNHDAARQHLETALERDPKHVEAHIGLAQAYLGLGRQDEAQEHAETSRRLPQTTPRDDWLAAINVTPAGAQARTRRGLQLQRAGKLDEAAAELLIALENNPHYTIARQRLAQILAQQGDRAGALALLREGLELQPGSSELQADLAALEAAGG